MKNIIILLFNLIIIFVTESFAEKKAVIFLEINNKSQNKNIDIIYISDSTKNLLEANKNRQILKEKKGFDIQEPPEKYILQINLYGDSEIILKCNILNNERECIINFPENYKIKHIGDYSEIDIFIKKISDETIKQLLSNLFIENFRVELLPITDLSKIIEKKIPVTLLLKELDFKIDAMPELCSSIYPLIMNELTVVRCNITNQSSDTVFMPVKIEILGFSEEKNSEFDENFIKPNSEKIMDFKGPAYKSIYLKEVLNSGKQTNLKVSREVPDPRDPGAKRISDRNIIKKNYKMEF